MHNVQASCKGLLLCLRATVVWLFREKAEDAAYEQDLKDSGIEIIDDNGNSLSGYALQDEIEFEFGDESQGISPEVDKARREAAFYILCIVRFVRVGLTIPERPGGTISNNGDNNTPGIGVLLPRDQLWTVTLWLT